MPEKVGGPCLVAMLSGSGVCRLNGQAEPIEAGSYLVVNQDSRLSLKANGQAMVLFFRQEVAKPALERRVQTMSRWPMCQMPSAPLIK